MLPYFFTWGFLAAWSLKGRRRLQGLGGWLMLAFLTLLIGLRDRVGGDWFNYLPALRRQEGLSLAEVLRQDEVSYALLNWVGSNVGGGVFFVNLMCGLVFSIGLLRFCRAQPRPWLALILAFPYLVVVVAMGYSRQAVAIGLQLLALLSLQRDRILRFLGWIALAATFHKTALVLLLLPAATLSGKLRFSRLLRLALLAVAGYGLYAALLEPDIAYYQEGYLQAEYQSEGALIRVLLCLLPALIFLIQRRRFHLSQRLNRIWTLMALLAVLAGVGLITVASSTAVDRLALYLIPLQLFVGSRLPDTRLFGLSPRSWNQLLIGLSLAVLSVWLLFASHSWAWIPYRNLLLPF